MALLTNLLRLPDRDEGLFAMRVRVLVLMGYMKWLLSSADENHEVEPFFFFLFYRHHTNPRFDLPLPPPLF